MTLAERVDEDLKQAMRDKNAAKLGVLRMLKSALKYAAIEKAGADGDLNDAEAVQVIRKQVKQRQDSIESFEKGGRAELVAKEKDELSILQTYLPQAMSADDLSKIVRETIAEVGATSKAQMGAVMKALQPKVAGRADGKTLSAEVQKQLRRGTTMKVMQSARLQTRYICAAGALGLTGVAVAGEGGLLPSFLAEMRILGRMEFCTSNAFTAL